jgi:hypothetical protein
LPQVKSLRVPNLVILRSTVPKFSARSRHYSRFLEKRIGEWVRSHCVIGLPVKNRQICLSLGRTVGCSARCGWRVWHRHRLAGYYCRGHYSQPGLAGSVACDPAIPRGITSTVAGTSGIRLRLFENRAVMIRRQLDDPKEPEPGRLYGGNRCFRGDPQFGRRAARLA